jgi:hypothetical protein
MIKILPLMALFTFTVMVSGCSPPETPTELPVPTPPLENVTCNELSFYLDPALGDGYQCETVPENSSSDIPAYYVFIYPTHTELTIQNYPLTHTQFPPQVWIYPVNRFSELLPDILPPRVSNLKEIISNGIRKNGELPFLPVIPQKQVFFIHAANLSFNGGEGVRFITEYSDAPTPITNKNIIYTFQGLTDDGMYWVALTLPISSPILPADYDTLPDGYTQESLIQNYKSYVNYVKEALEAQLPGSFSPTIDSLDSLVKSITVRQ